MLLTHLLKSSSRFLFRELFGWPRPSRRYRGGKSTAALPQTSVVSVEQLEDRLLLAAVIDLNGPAAGNDFSTTFNVNGAAVVAAASTATITDSGSSTLASLTVTLTNPQDGANEVLAADVTGTSIIATFNSITDSLTLVGVDTVANYQQVLRTVTYVDASIEPTLTARSLTFVADDGITTSNTATTTMAINPVVVTGATADIYGTSAASDTFALTLGSVNDVVTLNGVTYNIDPSVVSTINFHGDDGDAITVTGFGNATADLMPTSASLSGSGYTVNVSNVSDVTFNAGGGVDVATLNGSASVTNTFTGTASYSLMAGTGFSEKVVGFQTAYGISATASDNAYLYDSAGNDTFVGVGTSSGYPTYAYLTGSGFNNEAIGFTHVYAIASLGGNDTATLNGSAGDDTFVGFGTAIGYPTYAFLSGSAFNNEAIGFGQVYAVSSAGNDTATLYGSAGADSFVGVGTSAGYPTYAFLTGSGFNNEAIGFAQVIAVSSDANDTATLYASASGTNTFMAGPTSASLSGPSYSNVAYGFKSAVAISGGSANDTARLSGSAGDDTLVATPAYMILSGASFSNEAVGFKSTIGAAGSGGNDTATLYGDTAGHDTYAAFSTYTIMIGANFSAEAVGFKSTTGVSATGADTAVLYDSAGNDAFVAKAATSSGPFSASMTGSGVANVAIGFQTAFGISSAGGSDTADLFDSPSGATFNGSGNTAQLVGPGYTETAIGFSQVTLHGDVGTNHIGSIASLDYVFKLMGIWA